MSEIGYVITLFGTLTFLYFGVEFLLWLWPPRE